MVSQVRSQCKTILVNKALVLSVRRHHARITHQIMLLVLSSAGARCAKGSNEDMASCPELFGNLKMPRKRVN